MRGLLRQAVTAATMRSAVSARWVKQWPRLSDMYCDPGFGSESAEEMAWRLFTFIEAFPELLVLRPCPPTISLLLIHQKKLSGLYADQRPWPQETS